MKGTQLHLTYIQGLLERLEEDYKTVEQQRKFEGDGPTQNRLEAQLTDIASKIDALEKEEREVKRSLDQEVTQLSIAELKTTLESNSHQLDDMLSAYFKVLQQRSWRHLSEPKTPDDIVIQLSKIPKGESNCEAIEAFAAQLVVTTQDTDLISTLQKWGHQRLTQDWVKVLKQAEQSQVATESDPVEPALLVKISRSDEASTQSETETHYQVKAWLIRDVQHYKATRPKGVESGKKRGINPINIPGTTGDETYAKSLLPDELPKLIRQFLIESGHLFDIDPELHIFVPLELMNQAVDRWHLDDGYGKPRPLGRQYKIVLRCTERVSRSYRQVKLWKQKWQRHQSGLTQLAYSAFIAGNDDDLDELYYELDEADEPIVGLKVLTAPACKDANNLFGELLKVGMPLAIWGRQNLTQITNESELNRILNGCCLEKLPFTVREERRSARKTDEGSHIGYHLSLLWDDPHIVPPLSA